MVFDSTTLTFLLWIIEFILLSFLIHPIGSALLNGICMAVFGYGIAGLITPLLFLATLIAAVGIYEKVSNNKLDRFKWFLRLKRKKS